MPPGSRGRAGKFSKPTRGGMLNLPRLHPVIFTHFYLGGKKFSKNLTPLDADGNPTGMWVVSGALSVELVAQIDAVLRTNVMPKLNRHPRKMILLRSHHHRKKRTQTSQL